jgi:hypothetical protein
MENRSSSVSLVTHLLRLKIPLLLKHHTILKKSYGGTPEPQTAHDAPWLHGPSLKKKVLPHSGDSGQNLSNPIFY